MIFSPTLEMDNCPLCTRPVLPHAKKVKCAICFYYYHVICISLNHEDRNYIEWNLNSWYYYKCLSKVFPFNHIEENNILISEINNMDIESKTIESSNEQDGGLNSRAEGGLQTFIPLIVGRDGYFSSIIRLGDVWIHVDHVYDLRVTFQLI